MLYAWLPGQAMGEALADVLLGRAEPGGRLPVTLPAAEADCPVLHAVPRDGRIELRRGPAHRLPRLRREPAPARSSRSATASATPPGPTSRCGRPRRTWRAGDDLELTGDACATPGPGRAARWSRPTWPAAAPTRPAPAAGCWPRSPRSPRRPGAAAEVTLRAAGPGVRPLGRPGRGAGPGRRGRSPCTSGGRHGTCGCRRRSRRAAPPADRWTRSRPGSARPSSAGARRLGATSSTSNPSRVLQVGGVVALAAGVRVAVGEHQPPAVARRDRHQLLHLVLVGHVEGEVVQARAAPVVTARGAVRRLLEDDVGVPGPPAAARRASPRTARSRARRAASPSWPRRGRGRAPRTPDGGSAR